MAGITICCLKLSAGFANSLKDALKIHFGSYHVFNVIEMDEVESGILEKNQKRMAASDALLLLLDENWISTNPDELWFTHANNPARLLIADALIRKVRLVPVLMDRATLSQEELPDDLIPLTRRQAIIFNRTEWKRSFHILVENLEQIVPLQNARYTTRVASPRGVKQNTVMSRIRDISTRIMQSFKKELPTTRSGKKGAKMHERGGSSSEAKPSEPQEVHLAASTPQTIKPGSEFTARFVAYIKDAEAHVEKLLENLSPRSVSQMDIKRCQWQPGVKVTVSLSGRWLDVEEAEQTFVWKGPHTIIDFDVFLSPEAPVGNTILKYNIFIDGIRISTLRIDLEISQTSKSSSPTTVTMEAARTAFASYSSNDRQRVLDRLASVRISAGIEVFLDCLSLHPGENWKQQIAEEIKSRDQFLLFWSQSAADSKYVTWEWQTALDHKGKLKMQIHPLENNVPPPKKLDDLHFGDVLIALRDVDM